jgi:hypothetical protein
MNNWEKELLGDCVSELIAGGVRVELVAAESINDGAGECSGWYDNDTSDGKKELRVSCGREDWIEVFAHEYCHFTQDKDGMFENLDENRLWEWLKKEKEFPEEEVAEFIKSSRELEADNERRTVALFEKYAIPVDIAHYSKKCNAYILFYNTVGRDRKWSGDGKPKPYDVPEILARMSNEILDDFTDGSQWDWFHDLIREYCHE